MARKITREDFLGLKKNCNLLIFFNYIKKKKFYVLLCQYFSSHKWEHIHKFLEAYSYSKGKKFPYKGTTGIQQTPTYLIPANLFLQVFHFEQELKVKMVPRPLVFMPQVYLKCHFFFQMYFLPTERHFAFLCLDHIPDPTHHHPLGHVLFSVLCSASCFTSPVTIYWPYCLCSHVCPMDVYFWSLLAHVATISAVMAPRPVNQANLL